MELHLLLPAEGLIPARSIRSSVLAAVGVIIERSTPYIDVVVGGLPMPSRSVDSTNNHQTNRARHTSRRDYPFATDTSVLSW